MRMILKRIKERVFNTGWMGCVGAGPGLWIHGNRGAATCNVDTYGVLLHGVWLV